MGTSHCGRDSQQPQFYACRSRLSGCAGGGRSTLFRAVGTEELGTEHRDRPLTREGSFIGTLQYMAREQLEGEAADLRTDIFALGAVLHELATGRRAFEGASRTSLIAAIPTALLINCTGVLPRCLSAEDLSLSSVVIRA